MSLYNKSLPYNDYTSEHPESGHLKLLNQSPGQIVPIAAVTVDKKLRIVVTVCLC